MVTAAPHLMSAVKDLKDTRNTTIEQGWQTMSENRVTWCRAVLCPKTKTDYATAHMHICLIKDTHPCGYKYQRGTAYYFGDESAYRIPRPFPRP